MNSQMSQSIHSSQKNYQPNNYAFLTGLNWSSNKSVDSEGKSVSFGGLGQNETIPQDHQNLDIQNQEQVILNRLSDPSSQIRDASKIHMSKPYLLSSDKAITRHRPSSSVQIFEPEPQVDVVLSGRIGRAINFQNQMKSQSLKRERKTNMTNDKFRQTLQYEEEESPRSDIVSEPNYLLPGQQEIVTRQNDQMQIAFNRFQKQSQQPQINVFDYLERQSQTSLANQNMFDLQHKKFRKQQLACMGEKACLRFAMKEQLNALESLNTLMCKQSVIQEMVLSTDQIVSFSSTLQSQISQSPPIQNSINQITQSETVKQIKQILDQIVDHEDQDQSINVDDYEEKYRRMSNLRLADQIRMDSQMIQYRFQDFKRKQMSLYQYLLKEMEKTKMISDYCSSLQKEKHENDANVKGFKLDLERLTNQLNIANNECMLAGQQINQMQKIIQNQMTQNQVNNMQQTQQSTNSNILNNNSDETYQKYIANQLLSHQKLIAVEQASSSEQISTNYFPNQSPRRLLMEQDSRQLLQDSEIKYLSREYQVNQQYQALRRSRSQTHSNNQNSPSNQSQIQQKAQTILSDIKLNKQNEEILVKLSELQTDNEILRKRQQQLQNQIAEKEFNLCRYKVTAEELDAQTNINKDALQKASVLIKTMSEDLQDKNQQLEELQDKLSKHQADLLTSRQQIFALEASYKQKVQQLEQNLQHAESDELTKDLRLKIDEIKRTHKKELDELLDKKKLLEQELRLARKIKDDLEKSLQLKTEQLSLELKARAIDKLTGEDCLLNMKIDMAGLQKQFENDLDIKEEFVIHMQKIYEGKLQQFMHQEKLGEFVTPQRSYAHILWDEFKKTQTELSGIMQVVIRNKIKLDLERFEQFRNQVLLVFGDWMEKSKQLTNVSKRHGDVVEQYKLMTVRLKSLVKEKDMLVTNLTYQNNELKNQLHTFMCEFSNQSYEDKEYILQQFKASNKLLSMHLQAKFIECEQVIEQHTIFEQDQVLKDQEIQRLSQEIAKYQDELKFSRQENKVIQQKLQNLMQDVALAIENEQIENFNLENRKDRLSMTQPQNPRRDQNCLRSRSMSPTQRMANQPAIIVLSEGALINKVKRLVIERENYKRSTDSERKQIEDQLKEIGNLKADLALKEGSTSQRIKQIEQDFEKQQLEIQQTYKQYSEITQQKINHLEEILQNEKQQSQMMDRQLQRQEEKALEKVSRENELTQKISELQAEKEKAEYRQNQIQTAFDLQSNKFRALQDRTDQKVIELDEIQKQFEFLNRVRQSQEGQLQQQSEREQEIVSQYNEIQDKLKRSYLEHDKLEDKIQTLVSQLDQLNCEYQSQIKRNSESFQQIINIEKALNQAEMKNKELLDECRIQNSEIKRYQDSLTFLSREADELKLMALDAKIFEQQLFDAREQLDGANSVIKQLKALRDKKIVCNSVEVQTASNYGSENLKLQEQIADCEEEIYKLEEERNLLQGAVQRSFDDLNRVINSKRELESQILQIRQTQCQCNKPLDYNPVRPSSPQVNLSLQQNILKENEQYIQKLEYELNQLRDENQHLKEKIINFEVNNICSVYDGVSPNKQQRMVPHQLPLYNQRKQQAVQFSDQQTQDQNQKISRNNSRFHESTKDQTAETNFYSRDTQALRNNSFTQAEFKQIQIHNLNPKGPNESLRFLPAESDQVNLSKLHGSTYMSRGQMSGTEGLYQYYSDNRKDGTQQSFDGRNTLSPQTNLNLFRTDTVHEHWKQK